jgi:hypothetical protein
MDNPAADALLETVRKIKQMSQRARAGELGVEDYLRAVSSDPVTEWFTGLLREKNEELEKERERSDRLANALRAWRRAGGESGSEAELQLLRVLREMGIVEQ